MGPSLFPMMHVSTEFTESALARDQRRLAAIVSADVVGYSLLMGRDDSATLAGLKAHRQELFDPKIAEYHGRIVKTTGDGLLLEFPSVVDAVRCAVDVQRGMAERNAEVPPEQRIEFRIGINVGDVIIDDDDIFGDGVNVAARLQTLAEPGGICVSRVVRDQVLDKLNLGFEDLGAQAVKNIVRPVQAYRVELEAGAPTPPLRRHLQKLRQAVRWQWLGAAVAIVLVGSAVWYFVIRETTGASPGPPLMSVAVLPFTPASASADDEGVAERITQDITSATERAMRSALVVSHGLAAKYTDKALDPRTVGHDLNVRYVLEGDVRSAVGTVVVRARLIETSNGVQVWNDRVAAPLASSSDGIEDIIAQLTNRLRPALYDAEEKRVARLPKSDASARELVLSADALWDRDRSLNGMLEARKLYEGALSLEPGSAEALKGLGWTLYQQLIDDPAVDHDRVVKELDDVSSRAIRADRVDPNPWRLRTRALMSQWQWDSAFEANTEALRIDPYRNGTLGDRAILLLLTGRSQEALPLIDQAIALDPRNPDVPSYIRLKCAGYLLIGRYNEAIAACERSLALEDDWLAHMDLVAAYAQKGDTEKTGLAKADLLQRQPKMSLAYVKALRLSDNSIFLQQLEDHVYPGLRKAGIPEN
jgi:adenylate cyclase